MQVWGNCVPIIRRTYRIYATLVFFTLCGWLPGLQTRQPPIFSIWRDSPQWTIASSFTRFLDHTQRRTTVVRTPLDEWSARHRDLYLTTHNTHNRQTSMPPVGFEPTISAGERPYTYALDRAAIAVGRRSPTHSDKYQCRIDTVSSPDDGHIVARNMYRSWNKCTNKQCAPSWRHWKSKIYY